MKAIAIVRPPAATASAFVLRFVAWARRSDAPARADAASALARAYLHCALPAPKREDVATAMTALLDDPSSTVRRALSEALAGAREAPRQLVVALVNDESAVAEPLLTRSPLLTDVELVDCAIAGDPIAQCAIARRAGLGAGPALALADQASREAALVLLGNLGASLSSRAVHRIHQRFIDAPDVQDALLERPDLPGTLKAELAMTGADGAQTAGGRSERVARDARDAALVRIGAACEEAELAELARFLRQRGALTLSLLLRSLLSGERAPFAAALAELSGAPYARALALTRTFSGEGLAALMAKAGLPRYAAPAFRDALMALDTQGRGRGETLQSNLVRAAVASCEGRNEAALEPILALLWRFAAEAAQLDARQVAGAAIAERPRLPPSLDFSPAANDSAPLLLTADPRASHGDAACEAA